MEIDQEERKGEGDSSFQPESDTEMFDSHSKRSTTLDFKGAEVIEVIDSEDSAKP